MVPSGSRCPGEYSRTRRHLLPAAALLAALGAGALVLLSACSSPTAPTAVNPAYIDTTDCSGVPVSPDPCDASYVAPTFPALPCPTRAEVEELQSDFRVTASSDVSAGVLSCRSKDGSVDLTIVQETIYQSLLFLRRLRFDRPLPWTNLSVYDWARNAVSGGIVIESAGNSYAYLGQHTIHLAFTSYGWLLQRSFDTVPYGAILHEGRHAEGPWPHTCGKTAEYGYVRDKSIPEMGAYGVQYLLDYWIGNYSDEPADIKQLALRRASLLRQEGGAFCCECGGLRRASPGSLIRSGLFQQPGQVASTERGSARCQGFAADGTDGARQSAR